MTMMVMVVMVMIQVRAVWYKHRVEHMSSLLMPFPGKRGQPTDHTATQYVKDAKKVNEVLHKGTIGRGTKRTPIAGDTTKLRMANELNSRQRHLAQHVNFKAQHMPGSNQHVSSCFWSRG